MYSWVFQGIWLRVRDKLRKGVTVKKNVIAKTCVMIMVLGLMAGCASMGGPKDEDLIAKRVEAFNKALIAKSADDMVANFSEAFSHPEAGDKAGARDFLQQAVDAGYLDDAEVDMANAQTKLEGDTATIYPIVVSSSAGSATLGLTLKKEGKNWMITMMDIEGV